ncbi:hypothetical protein ACWEN6_27080 [Sphaerisporangium sp. NPDC004334]
MRALTRAAWAAAMTIVVATAGCASESALLYIDQDVTFTATLPDTTTGKAYSLGSWVVCLDRPGSVTIDKAELLKPSGGIRLQAVSARPQSRTTPMLGNVDQPLTKVGFPARPPAITTVCGKDGDQTLRTELGLQYGKTGDATARAEGVRLTYTSAGRRHSVDFSMVVELCAPGDTRTPRCKELYKTLGESS